jgi:hypothetical protein
LENNQRLRFLFLGKNKIRNIDSIENQILYIEELILCENQIQSIPEKFSFPYLRFLDLNENNIKNISNFYKNLNEDYSNIENIAYELIFPFSQTYNALEQLIIYYKSESNFSGIFNLLKIILKFPNIINKTTDSSIKLILNFIYEISSKLSKNSLIHKKILIQSLGLIVAYISNQREIINKGIMKIENAKV